MTAPRIACLLAIGVGLVACGGDDEEASVPTGGVDAETSETIAFTDNELGMIRQGEEASARLPDDIAEAIADAVLLENWDEICSLLDASTETIERDKAMAVSADAFDVQHAINGHVMRLRLREQFVAKCDVDRADHANREALGN